MMIGHSAHASASARRTGRLRLLVLFALAVSLPAIASTQHVSEANLVLPDLADRSLVTFPGGVSGWTLLSYGLFVALGGLVFGGVIYRQIRRLPVHRSMAEVSELIYETCKTYMITQGRFLLIKLVHRVHSLEFPYRMVKNGFYVGIGAELVYYPMPSHMTLRRDHITWWRSANL